MIERLQDVEPFAGHDPRAEKPLGGYATLTGAFLALVGGFSAWMRASGRELPERMAAADLALITVASHKASRLIARERVTSTVRAPFTRLEDEPGPGKPREKPRGSGVRRAVGELVLCPYCLSLWIASAFAVGLVLAPRPTRWVAAVLTSVFGSDLLQIAYRKAEGTV